MENTITLNETQMKLLKEFMKTCDALKEASRNCAKSLEKEFVTRDVAACVFASSVAEELKS